MGLSAMTPYNRKSMTIKNDSEYSMLASSFIHWERRNLYHTVISGGHLNDRTAVELSMIRMARQTRDRNEHPVPVVILEQGNPVLERRYCREGANARFADSRVRVDPLAGLPDLEIASRLYDVAGKLDRNCSSGLRGLLRIGCELLRRQNIEPGIFTLSKLPWTRLSGLVDRMVENEELEQEEAIALLGELGQLSGDPDQAANLIHQLSQEYSTMVSEAVPAVSLEQLIDKDGIGCLCLRSGMRAMRELIALSLLKATLSAKPFLLVADSVSVPGGDSVLRELLFTRSTEYAVVLSYDDMPAVLSDQFSSLVSGDTNIILFAHQSGNSAKRWAEFIGECYQEKVTRSFSESHSKTQLLDRQVSKSVNKEEELRYRIASEQLQSLPVGQAIVQSGAPRADLWFVNYPHLFELQQQNALQLRGR